MIIFFGIRFSFYFGHFGTSLWYSNNLVLAKPQPLWFSMALLSKVSCIPKYGSNWEESKDVNFFVILLCFCLIPTGFLKKLTSSQFTNLLFRNKRFALKYAVEKWFNYVPYFCTSKKTPVSVSSLWETKSPSISTIDFMKQNNDINSVSRSLPLYNVVNLYLLPPLFEVKQLSVTLRNDPHTVQNIRSN